MQIFISLSTKEMHSKCGCLYIRHNENKELAVFYIHKALPSEGSLSSLHGEMNSLSSNNLKSKNKGSPPMQREHTHELLILGSSMINFSELQTFPVVHLKKKKKFTGINSTQLLGKMYVSQQFLLFRYVS